MKCGFWSISPESGVISDVVPNQQYTLTVVAQRLAGAEAFCIGLVVAGRRTMLGLEGWGGHTSGLSTVDRRKPGSNATTFRSTVFRPGKPTTIVCTVRKSSLEVTCNGETVLQWEGDPERIDVDQTFGSNLPADRLFLGSWATCYRISKLELVPLGN